MSKPALENIDLNQFVHNPYNRALSPDLIEETKKHIQDTGEIKPIIYVELDPHTLQEPFNEQKKPLKMVIDGHHRLEALKSLGHKTAPALKATNGLLTSDKTNEVSVEKIKVKKEGGEESNENASSEEPTAMMEAKDVEKYITSSNGKWTVHAESGKHLGTYGSKAEATHRLQQIEYFKHKKMTKADVKKYVQQEGKLWVVRSNDGSRVLGEFRSKDAANMQEELIDNLRATKMSRAEVTTKVQSLAKAWFGESERHADVAAGQNTGLRGSQPKSEIHHGLKTAIKIAALGALAVGGIAALSHPSIRGAIGNAAKSLLHRLPSSKVANSAYKATVEAGGHTVSLTGEIPTARYMFSPYKANEKIIPMKSFHPHHIDNYIKENKHLLTKPNHHLGTWHNKETGNVHLDVSIPHHNRLEALTAAQKHNQLAIFDSHAASDIPVNESTINQAKYVEGLRQAVKEGPHSWMPRLADEGFSHDTLQESMNAIKGDNPYKQINMVYHPRSGKFAIGDLDTHHEVILNHIQTEHNLPGKLDQDWLRMSYATHADKPPSLTLWDWSTEAEAANGNISDNYARGVDALVRNKKFPDNVRLTAAALFHNKSTSHTLGEWRELYGKAHTAVPSIGKSGYTEAVQKLENKALNLQTNPYKSVLVYQNPTQANVNDLHRAYKEKYPKSPIGEPKTRTTYDASGNEYSWMSGDATHADVEHVLDSTRGTKHSQNKHLIPLLNKNMVSEDFQNIMKKVNKIQYTDLISKASKTLADGLAKVYRVSHPTEDSAQANTQDSIERVRSIDDELVSLFTALKELEGAAREQQLLSDDEISEIIYPLQENVTRLLETLRGGSLEDSTPEAPESETQPDETSGLANDPQRQRKKPFGPTRQVGTAERDLEEPATDFVRQTATTDDIAKTFFGFGGGRGWRGDPEGHAEAARERWEVANRTSKPGEGKTGVHHAIKDVAIKTARHTGNRIARVAGEAIADIGLAAFGTVAGVMILSHLKGSPIPMMQAGKLGLQSLKNAVEHSFKMVEVTRLKNDVKIARLNFWLKNPGVKLSQGPK